jgi:hypothetical protein
LNRDPWQHWQDYVTAMSFGAGASPPRSSAGAAHPFATFAQAAAQFSETAGSFAGAAHQASAQAQAAATFIDTIRELYSTIPLSKPFDFGSSGLPGASPFATDQASLGAAREHQQRMQRLSQAWQEIEQARGRLQRLWSDALHEAATTFAARVGSSSAAGLDAEAMHKLYDNWIDCAEDAYAQMVHSQSFCDSQAEFVNASSCWRQEFQGCIEHSAKFLDFPTRSEVNSLTERLQMAERQLRSERDSKTSTKAPKSKSPRAKKKPT